MDPISADLVLAKLLLHRGLRAPYGVGIFGSRTNLQEMSNFAARSVAQALSIADSLDLRFVFEIKLRMAMHFAPPEAINHDSSRPESRKDLIHKYLTAEFGMPQEVADDLSSEVATVLRNFQTSRKTVSDKLDAMLLKHSHQCCACHLRMNDSKRREEEEKKGQPGTDAFKPYFHEQGPSIWMSPEVDHIEPVSGFGTNNLENLQLLCRLCNQGKDDGLGVSIAKEARHAHTPIKSVPHGHIVRMLYSRLAIDDFRCQICSSNSNELTVRKKRNAGPYVLSNLFSVCYRCTDKSGVFYCDYSAFNLAV